MATLDEILSDPKALEAVFRGLIGAGTAAAGISQATTPQTTTIVRGAPGAASPLESEALGLSYGTMAGQLSSLGVNRAAGGVLFQPTSEEQQSALGLRKALQSMQSRTRGGPWSIQGPGDAMTNAALTRKPTLNRKDYIAALKTRMPGQERIDQGSVLNMGQGEDGSWTWDKGEGGAFIPSNFTTLPSSTVGTAPRVATSTSGGGGLGSVLGLTTGGLGVGAGALQVAKALGLIGGESAINPSLTADDLAAIKNKLSPELLKWFDSQAASLEKQFVPPFKDSLEFGMDSNAVPFPTESTLEGSTSTNFGPNTPTSGWPSSALGLGPTQTGMGAEALSGLDLAYGGAGESALGLSDLFSGLISPQGLLTAGFSSIPSLLRAFGVLGQAGAKWDKKAQGWIRAAAEEAQRDPTGFTQKLGSFDQSVLMSRQAQGIDDNLLRMSYEDASKIQRELAVKAYQGTLTGHAIADAYDFDKDRRGTLFNAIAQWKKGPNDPISPVELWQLGNGLSGEEGSIPRLLIDREKMEKERLKGAPQGATYKDDQGYWRNAEGQAWSNEEGSANPGSGGKWM